ncbi:MAG TPA: hypothetical protein VII63_02900 [Caulobacteraceae bacterium]
MYRALLHLGFAIEVGILAAVFAFAIWKGGRPERIGAALNLGAGILATALYYLLSIAAQPVALLAVDAALAAGFLFLALRYASLWLGAALLLQAVQFSLHAYYLVVNAHHDWNYMVINNLDTTGINVCIVAGTILAWRRQAIAKLPPAADARPV